MPRENQPTYPTLDGTKTRGKLDWFTDRLRIDAMQVGLPRACSKKIVDDGNLPQHERDSRPDKQPGPDSRKEIGVALPNEKGTIWLPGCQCKMKHTRSWNYIRLCERWFRGICAREFRRAPHATRHLRVRNGTSCKLPGAGIQ
jgi:hypothetical protein